jgi:methionyl-tRNA synthetase
MGQNTEEPKAPISLESAELEFRLESTRERLRQAGFQLVELARMLLAPTPPALPASDRSVFKELVLTQTIADVQDAARELHKAHEIATQRGTAMQREESNTPGTRR